MQCGRGGLGRRTQESRDTNSTESFNLAVSQWELFIGFTKGESNRTERENVAEDISSRMSCIGQQRRRMGNNPADSLHDNQYDVHCPMTTSARLSQKKSKSRKGLSTEDALREGGEMRNVQSNAGDSDARI